MKEFTVYAEMAQNGPVPTALSPTDRLSLLPRELHDKIYSLVFQSDDSPWTLHIKPKLQPFKYNGWIRPESILALPQDCKYKALRRENFDEKWPDNVEEAFFRALDWAYNHRPDEERMSPYYNETISGIIYELTGIRRCRKKVSSHIQLLKNWVFEFEPESEHILLTISGSITKLQRLDASKDIHEITKTITLIQSILPKLQSAFQSEHDSAIPTPPRPISTDLSSSPTITPHSEFFRSLSSSRDSYLSISLHPTPPPNFLSLTLVNRFHRTHALSILASALIFDFGDNTKVIYTLRTPSITPYIKRINLLFVEGYMHLSFINLADRRSTHPTLPSLHELSIEIWPRDPTRENRDDMSWGEQTVRLLKTLGEFRGGGVRVVVVFRFESDCGRLEQGYVGWRRRRRMEVDGGGVEEGSVCTRFYELKRS